MPYGSNPELPASVRNNLPAHAQEIYRKAFNSAWDDYSDPEDRRGNSGREETAHKVAWAAVKKEYHKEGDQWGCATFRGAHGATPCTGSSFASSSSRIGYCPCAVCSLAHVRLE